MGKYFKVTMFITSFIPLWITIGFLDILSILKGGANLWSEKISMFCILVAMFFSMFTIFFSMKSIRDSSYKEYKIIEVTQEKGITSEFLLSYILPLFAFDFTSWESIVQFLIYFIVLAFLCIRNNNVYANLVFECRGYKFYACELQWQVEGKQVESIQTMVISKANLCAQKGNIIKASLLNKPFYLMKDLEE